MKSLIIRPSLWKSYLINLFKVFLATCIIILFAWLLDKLIGVNNLMPILNFFEISISREYLISRFISAVIIVSFIVLMLIYLGLTNVRYEFLEDRLLLSVPLFFILTKKEEIPYKNILYANYKKTIVESILDIGRISIKLREKNRDSIEMELIDYADEYSTYINKVLNYYRAKKKLQDTSMDKLNVDISSVNPRE